MFQVLAALADPCGIPGGSSVSLRDPQGILGDPWAIQGYPSGIPRVLRGISRGSLGIPRVPGDTQGIPRDPSRGGCPGDPGISRGEPRGIDPQGSPGDNLRIPRGSMEDPLRRSQIPGDPQRIPLGYPGIHGGCQGDPQGIPRFCADHWGIRGVQQGILGAPLGI